MFGFFKKKENISQNTTQDDSLKYELISSRLEDLFANCLKVIEHDAHQAVFGEILSKESKEYQGIFDYYGGKLNSDVLFARMLCNVMGWNSKLIDDAIKRGREKAIEEYNTGCDLKELLNVDEELKRDKVE